MTATCFACRKGLAEPDIDQDDTKPGHARGVRYRGESPAGKARCGILPGVVSITVDARGKTMGFSCRTFLIARDDTLWRLSSTKFGRMLRDPASHCLLVFAGQRVRMASAAVVLPRRQWSSTSACRRPCCSTVVEWTRPRWGDRRSDLGRPKTSRKITQETLLYLELALFLKKLIGQRLFRVFMVLGASLRAFLLRRT
jgi:hypothetical protein